MSRKTTYEDAFSGRTRAILLTLNHIFLDSGLDIRTRHMFGHKSFLLNGHVFMLVGEWARDEDKKAGIVQIADRGKAEATMIVIPPDDAMAQAIMKKYGGLYFAPSGTRLKSWVSLNGLWLTEEEKILPLVTLLLKAYEVMPEKTSGRPGRRV
ncbi:MAG TPA: hypothetical protein VFO10_13980 [Oligoflexus sp.]|uniref:hypothetical protein n=1 Tax=Oligoflexus sp. TaxID=1971216 RepID=UPI002D7EADED|nr:hypothetical protein [Oligoflexus sp.]HET9238365.1 hypothetical protein [Oligoflexus sp.]